jgi:hypothetical protein
VFRKDVVRRIHALPAIRAEQKKDMQNVLQVKYVLQIIVAMILAMYAIITIIKNA